MAPHAKKPKRRRPAKGAAGSSPRALRSKRPPSGAPAFPPDMARALEAAKGVTFEPGWGAGNVVAKAKGKLFVLFVGGELVFKLPEVQVDALVARRLGRRFDPRKNGQLMKEWLVVPADFSKRKSLALDALRFVTS